MADKPRRIYWDSGCFLCFLNKKEAVRRQICEDILQNAKVGKVVIYTSTFTIAEVIYPKRSTLPNPRKLTPVEITKISGMFRWPWLRKVDLDQRTAFYAVDLAREHNLLPADAVQAASAILQKVDALQRWDRDFSAISHLVRVEEPTRMSPQAAFPDMLRPIGPTPEDFGDA
jgi:predicted nucleic acid-binding protein